MASRSIRFLLYFLLAAIFALAARGQEVVLPDAPDPVLTPGAVATTDVIEICAVVDGLSYSKRHRVWHDQRSTLRKYRLPLTAVDLVEDDDRVPVCAGGDNASPLNHWPQELSQAVKKDRLEDWACRQICVDRSMTPAEVQTFFLRDWRGFYVDVFGEEP